MKYRTPIFSAGLSKKDHDDACESFARAFDEKKKNVFKRLGIILLVLSIIIVYLIYGR